MKLPTSDKASSFGPKPHIKKGYYPGRLLNVEIFSNSDGSAKIGKFGKQLIFEFAIFKADQETDAPVAPMKYCTDEKMKTMADVIISKFAYHEYKNSKKGADWIESDGFRTAITPKSDITKLLKALGWELTADGVDPDDFIGNWVELNIDDYEQGEGDEQYTASTIKDVGPYEGPQENLKEFGKVTKPDAPRQIKKAVKHEAVDDEPKRAPIESKDVQGLKDKIESMEKLHEEGLLTKSGLDDATEQLQARIDELVKK